MRPRAADLSADGGSQGADRIAAILRWEGPRGVVARALARLGWRSYELWTRPLEGPIPCAESAAVPIEVRALGPGDAAAYHDLRPGCAADLDHRLRAGHACFAASSAGRIVAVIWVAVGPVKVPYLKREIVPGPSEIYLFDIYVTPGQRGARLTPRLFAAVAEFHRARGYRRALSLIARYNRSSIRAHERMGFRRAGKVNAFSPGTIRTADLPGLAGA